MPTFDDADVDAFIFLDHPDPVDAFEDALAMLLGLEREPWSCYRSWRVRRRRFIERHPLADWFAERAARIVDQEAASG